LQIVIEKKKKEEEKKSPTKNKVTIARQIRENEAGVALQNLLTVTKDCNEMGNKPKLDQLKRIRIIGRRVHDHLKAETHKLLRAPNEDID